MNLLRQVEVVYLTSEGESKQTHLSHQIDMAGYEGCMFIAVGTSETAHISTTRARATVQGCSSTTLASFTTYLMGSTRALVINAGTAITAGTRVGKIPFIIDLYKPLKRYARIQQQDITTGGVHWIGILYGRKRPGTTATWTSTERTVLRTTVIVSPVT